MPGASACMAKFRMIAKNVDYLVREKVDTVSNKILTVSKKDYVPVDKGQLRDSGKIEKHKNGDEYYNEISFNTPYAFIVHEKPMYHKHGQKKYLEVPVKMHRAELIKEIKSAFKESL